MKSFGGHSINTIENNSIPITETGCWLWEHSLNKDGYGFHIRDGDKRLQPHVLSYILHNNINEIPNGKQVNHACDIPSCTNPNHLYLGTQKQNMLDKVIRGRCKKTYKLTEEEYSIILESELSSIQLSKFLPVDSSTIRYIRIKNGQKRNK